MLEESESHLLSEREETQLASRPADSSLDSPNPGRTGNFLAATSLFLVFQK